MKTDIIHIIFPGDPSVGIFPARFELKEVQAVAGSTPIEFEDKESMDEFMKGLAELFEQHITGYQCYCVTDEQLADKPDPKKSPTYERNSRLDRLEIEKSPTYGRNRPN